MFALNVARDERLGLTDQQKVGVIELALLDLLIGEPPPELLSLAREIPAPRSGLSAAVRQLVYERDEFRCLACGSTENLTIDHIVPVSCGGSDAVENLQTLCGSCNSAKGTQTVDYRACGQTP